MLIVSLAEEERQFVLLSLAILSLERPGFEYLAREISVKLQGEEMLNSFRELNSDQHPAKSPIASPAYLGLGEYK